MITMDNGCCWKARSVMYLFFIGLIVLCFLVIPVDCHPQCLDYRPPFKADTPSPFCTEYVQFGCCTTYMDQEVANKYRSIIKNDIDQSIPAKCQQYLRELLCQTCSPYSAHVYDAEATLQPRTFPGLCSGYCLALYNDCKGVVRLAYTDSSLLSSLVSVSQFCSHVSLTDIDYCYPELLTNPILTQQVSPVIVNAQGCLCVEEIADGLRNPLLARHADDNSRRLFIAEQVGLVHILLPNRTILNKTFLDLTESVLTSEWEGDERGFLGLAFHPNFQINKRFFVYYSIGEDSDVGDHVIRISEFHVSRDDDNRADHGSERVILEVDEPYWNHNGGELMFGDDGYLYIFVGDGGAGGDPHGNSQNKSSLLGKVLRIDVDKLSPGLQYTIPPDNPFILEPGSRHEIFAYGVRNIWRCGKDRGNAEGKDRGRIVCGDVGQSAFEELDLLTKGANYGWNSREGFTCYNKATCGKIGPEVLPIHAYSHRVGKSVTGGHFYRGCESPNLDGLYIYGDYVRGRLFGLADKDGLWENKELFMCGPDICLNGLQSTYELNILSFGEDEQGEVYMLSTSNASPHARSGKVYKIVDPARRGNPEMCSSVREQNYGDQRAETGSTIVNPTSSDSSENAQEMETGDTKSTGMVSSSFGKVNMMIVTCILIPRVMCSTYQI